MERARYAVFVVVGLTIACATAGPDVGQAADCQPGDHACHNAAWQQTSAALQHQEAMVDARRSEDEAWMREVLAEAKQGSRIRAKEMAQLRAAQWWCFEGQDNEQVFGECRPTAKACSTIRGRRVAAGLTRAKTCQPYAHAACFNATVSLKHKIELFCFPLPELCVHYREQAIARDLVGVSACGLL